MKLNGIFGTGSGKTGNAVFATSAGKQIVRIYQPKVTNPNTDAQIAQRAKFKLVSQLAAAMALVIVIPKKELVSARNRFVKKNIPLATYGDDKASIELAAIQLTESVTPIPDLNMSTGSGQNTIHVELAASVFDVFKKVRYALFKKTEDSKLQLVSQVVVDVDSVDPSDAGHDFSGLINGSYVAYAYGMNPKNASASVGYNNYDTEAGETSADLETTLRISTYNYDFSVTKADELTLA